MLISYKTHRANYLQSINNPQPTVTIKERGLQQTKQRLGVKS